MRRVSLAVNGVRHELDLEPRELLVYVLRDRLGLTGTNVGCDTSSCGACTVLLNGESVKSCTLLGVQADGMELTTIEGLASNGDLHPLQQAFHEQHGLQCGYCTPGMVMAAASLLAQNPEPSERDPARARGQPLPLHRLPEHRRGRAHRGRRSGGVDGHHRDPHHRPRRRHVGPAQGGPQARHRQRPVHRQHQPARARSGSPSSAAPYAHARIGKVDLAAARKVQGVVAAFSGAELAADWAGSLPCAWPVTEEIRMPSHFPLAFDKARHVGDGVAVVVAETRAIAKDAAELVEVEYEPLGAVADVAKALDDGAPLVHDDLGTNECYVWKLDAGEVDQAFADADVTVKRQLPPAAADPGGDGAARRRSPRSCRAPAS